MIVTIAIDTDEDKDGIETLAEFVGVVRGRKSKFLLKAEDVKAVKNMYEAARRRSAGEQVIYKAEPKKRGRKPKNPKEA